MKMMIKSGLNWRTQRQGLRENLDGAIWKILGTVQWSLANVQSQGNSYTIIVECLIIVIIIARHIFNPNTLIKKIITSSEAHY